MTYRKPEIDWGDIQVNGNGAPGMENLRTVGHALGGAGLGAAQGLSDIGANIAQFPGDAYHYFTGKQGYTSPKPDLREYTPNSQTGRNFEKGGEIAAPFLSPVMAAEMAGGKALYGSRMIPRLIANALGGAAEADSEYRGQGAALGAAAPAVGAAIRGAWKTPLLKSSAVRKLNKGDKLAAKSGDLNIPMDLDFIRNMEYQMKSKHLSPAKEQLNTLMGNAAKGDYRSYKDLHGAMGDISRELLHPASQSGGGIGGFIKNFISPPQSSAAERLTGHQINNLRHQYIADALAHLEKTGHSKLANLDKEGRDAYRRYMEFKPTRNKLIGAAAGVAGIPGYHLIKNYL